RRERQRVRLADAGRWLLAEGRALVEHAERLGKDAARHARGDAGSLAIGFVQSAVGSELLPHAPPRLRPPRPGPVLRLRNMASAPQLAALRRGELDLALVNTARGEAGVRVSTLRKEAYVLALPRRHRLARRRAVSPAALRGEPWVVIAREQHPLGYDHFV